jgi:peptidoglycan pentaglycine glycine transferase (the first glycine)
MQLLLDRFVDGNRWNQLLCQDLEGRLLQSWEWGQFKQRFGWKADYLSWKDHRGQTMAATLVLKRSFLSHFSILYCPRGPILDWSNEAIRSSVLSELQKYSASAGAIFIKIDPDIPLGTGETHNANEILNPLGQEIVLDLERHGWKPSDEQIQFKNSMHLYLGPSEDELLMGMKSKTRYNIRLAGRRGVRVRKGNESDMDLLYRMYAATSLRDGFTIREQAYYQDAWGSFMKSGMAQPFIAEVEGESVAGIIVFHYGKRAIYMYGMSLETHREMMPNHLLQWEAIRWAKAMGYAIYDFWGAPDTFKEQDPMWGVYRFKSGFGAEVIRTPGAWDFVTRPTLYKFYSVILPKVLSIMRKRGRILTTQSLKS